MAMTADDEDYAHVVLICSGQFSDPDLKGRLSDITRQLHMLNTGAKEPLVTSVEPWNSVRVTLKLSRESAALLQTLAQQQDPQLLDIGILSVHVEGSNPVCLNRVTETSYKLNAARVRLSADSSVYSATNSSALGVCQSALHGQLPHTAVSTVQEIAHTGSRVSVATSSVNQSWHPLVNQRTATSTDDNASAWDPFGYNGLSVDPFQFSADDLLTRMLADVPAPKRRQRMRKGSASSAMHTPFLLSNTVPLTLHEDCSSKIQPSSAQYSVSYSTAFGIPSAIQSYASQKTAYFDKDRVAVGSSQHLSSAYNSQVNDLYGVYVNSRDMPSVSSHPLYNHQQNMSSAAGMLPLSLDSMMTVSNRAIVEARCINSDQPPVKRRHVKSRNSTDGFNMVSTYGDGTEVNRKSPFRDICSEGAVGKTVTKNNIIPARSPELHLQSALGSRFAVHSPRALWPDGHHGHSVLPTRYPNVDACRFRLPYQQSYSWTHSNSSYMYSDVPVTGPMPFVPDVRKPFSVAGGIVARPSSAVSLPNHSVSTVNEALGGTTRRPCHQQSLTTVDLRHGGVSDRSLGTSSHTLTSSATCTSFIDQQHIGNRLPPASSHVGVVPETCSTVDYCGMVVSSVQQAGNVQSTSPRDAWTGSDSDYGSASVTDSGIASNTSLSVGSDHSENDRGSVEMNAADPSVKLSPVSAADRICAPSSPPLASSADSLSEPLCDGSVATSCGSLRMNLISAGQNGDSCIAASKHSGKPQNWLGDSQNDNKKSGQLAQSARMRFARRSRQTPTLAGECPPAITCPSLPRRLSESVKRAMRGGAATDPPMTSAPCDIGPTKVVIRITKTRCSGTGEAKRSKQKEQWCVQPIVKPFQSPSDTTSTLNGTLDCSTTNNTKESCIDSDGVSVTDPFDKSVHQDVMSMHCAADKRDSSQSADFNGRPTDSIVQQLDGALHTMHDEQADADMMICSDQDLATSAAVRHENGAESTAVMQSLTYPLC